MVAVDVMGGDYAPHVPIKGALEAARKGIPVLLCGPKQEVISYLCSIDSNWETYPIEILDAKEVIGMGDDPVKSVTQKKNSSLVMAIQSVKDGLSMSAISAGNSGAIMAASNFIIGRQEGILRTPIAGFLPAMKNPVLSLDLGANTECRPIHLKQFAELGVKYLLQDWSSRDSARVGLLANGHEGCKGSLLVKDTYEILKDSKINFVGYIEPMDIISNKVDVVVCDGFTGNILLKAMESAYSMIINMIPDSGLRSVIEEKVGWENAGGALLLGLNGTVVVSHGCSNAIAIENAIRLAHRVALSIEKKDWKGKSV